MDCEHAITLLSARLDREIKPDDAAQLEAHLVDCAACRATADAFALQHAELREAFEPRRAAAVVVAQKVTARLPATRRPRWSQRTSARIGLVAGGIAAALAILMLWHRSNPSPTGTQLLADGTLNERLVPRPRPADLAIAKLATGDALETKPGERRRVGLPDGSVLYVNQNTRIRLDGERSVQLERGEVFVEVTERDARFVVKTPARTVTALGTKFEVRADADRTGVVVTQGKVEVSGLDAVLYSGQALTAQGVEPAPRASHLLDWTRDLMAAAESPLVPASAYAGGSLIAVDVNGQEAKLSLRRFNVDVHIEDGFARTTIDQTYFNQHPWRLEGTFYFPLPPDASLSRLAMYVADGSESNLMEGGMAERDHARTVYDRIVSSQRDPALLEWVDGSTFKMRVFPLEGRQEKRILLAYTQRLTGLYGQTQYRFPAGHSLQTVREWDFHAVIKGAGVEVSSPTHPLLRVEPRGGDLVVTDHGVDARLDQDVVLDLSKQRVDFTKMPARFVRAELDGQDYLALRYVPIVPCKIARQRRDWVFLFEASADRDPLLARAQIEVIRHLLSNVEHDDTFAIVTAGTRTHLFRPTPLPATPANVRDAVEFLERTHLVGALDLGNALRTAAPLLKAGKNPFLVHVGSGLATIGRKQERLAELFAPGVHYVGIGVGKRWNRAWMKEMAEKTAGYFTQINPDETISWRVFELQMTLMVPRLLDVKVTAGADPRFLTDTTMLSLGDELFAVTRVPVGTPLPTEITVTATLDGEPFRAVLPVQDATSGAGYLPRTWAKWELDRLLLDYQHTGKNATKEEIVALSKAMYVMTPFTSLLVLENEKMYAEFKVDRGRKDHWALYETPSKIPTVYEPLADMVDVRNAPRGLKPKANQVIPTVLVRGSPRFVNRGNQEWVTGQRLSQVPSTISTEILKPLPTGGVAGIRFGTTRITAQPDPRDRERAIDIYLESVLEPPGNDRLFGPLHSEPVTALDPSNSGKQLRYLNLADAIGIAERAETLTSNLSRANGTIISGTLIPLGDVRDPLGPINEISGGYNGLLVTAREDNTGSLMFGVGGTSDSGLTGNIVRDKRPSYLIGGVYSVTGNQYAVTGNQFGSGIASIQTYSDQPIAFDTGTGERASDGVPFTFPASALIYTRPAFTADFSLFTDLVSYAPGLNTSQADRLAVLEDEAAPNLRSAPGSIDPAARKLIDRARTSGWRSMKLPNGVVFTFDGTGRYAYERDVALGLHEHVVCDGTTLLHLYPNLGLAARRTVTRFHRAELASVVPGWLPPAADMAHGCDLECIDAHTVALVPHGAAKAYVQYRLVFADDGRLVEQQLVRIPEKKILVRVVYDGDGGVRVLDATDKEVITRKHELTAVKEPNLLPDTNDLVVLPLPYRSATHTFPRYVDASRPLSAAGNFLFPYVAKDRVLPMLASLLAEKRGEDALLFVRTHFFNKGDLRPGLFTILAASGADLRDEPALKSLLIHKPSMPLVRYLGLGASDAYTLGLRNGPITLAADIAPVTTFLGRLAAARELTIRWQNGAHPWLMTFYSSLDVPRTLAFVHDNRDSVLGWAMLLHMQQHGNHSRSDFLAMAKAWEELAGKAKNFQAQYEQACCLADGGKEVEACNLFEELYARVLKAGGLPAIDARFYRALLGQKDRWTPLLRSTAAKFIQDKQRSAVVYLAWQCQQLGDPILADNLLADAIDSITDDAERLPVYLTAIDFLAQTSRSQQASKLMDELLKNETWNKAPALWRLAARLTQGDAAAECLERALDLEYQHLPEVIDLGSWRQDYNTLLTHYRSLAGQTTSTKAPLDPRCRSELAARTIRAADRWRAHDADATGACQTAGEVLHLLGENELAWDYLTTPNAMQPDRTIGVRQLAASLSREGNFVLAENAYAVAVEAESRDPQIVWERAQNLRSAGQNDAADTWLRQLAAAKDDEDVEWRRAAERAAWELRRR